VGQAEPELSEERHSIRRQGISISYTIEPEKATRGNQSTKEYDAHRTSTSSAVSCVVSFDRGVCYTHTTGRAHRRSDRATHLNAASADGHNRADEHAGAADKYTATNGHTCAHGNTAADEHTKTHSDEGDHAEADECQERSCSCANAGFS